MTGSPRSLVLLVEDNPADVRLTIEAFSEHGPGIQVDVASNGEAGLEYFAKRTQESARLPDLVLLDLNMPRMGGRDFLAALRADPRLKSLPVIVLTSSEASDDLASVYDLGANCYIRKPLSFDGFLDVVDRLVGFWFSTARLPTAP